MSDADETITITSDAWPGEAVHEPKNLFREQITDRPTVQYIDQLPADDWGDHFATRLMDFPEITMTHVSIKVSDFHPVHYHIEGPHVAVFLSGVGQMRVGDEEFPVRPGAVVIIPPSVVHFTRNLGQEPLNYVQLISPTIRETPVPSV